MAVEKLVADHEEIPLRMAASTASEYFGIGKVAPKDETETELERSLGRVITISAVVVLMSGLAAPFSMKRVAPTLALHVLFSMALGAAYYYLRTNRRRRAGAVLATGFWFIATVGVFAFGGVHSPGVFVYLPVVAVAGLFWSGRAASLLGLASAGSVLVAAQLEALGALPAPLAPIPPERLWTVFCGSLLMTAVLFLSAVKRVSALRRDLAQSKTLLESLASAQERAESERSELERRLRSVERLETVGRLAGGVAHDFNNLLGVIMNSANVLRREVPRGSIGAELLGDIDDATKRAIELVRKLLANPAREKRAPKIVDLNQVVTGLSSIIKRLAGPEIDVVIDTRAERSSVLADATELEQVILNLALNARDAMPLGGRLSIETRSVPSDGEIEPNGGRPSFIALVVTDQGVGMDAATAGRVFEPFFTTKGSAGGTGLGLASVKRIVDQARGRIQLETSPGKGATFEILLPHAAVGEGLKRAGETLRA
jgi:signal transduction histidine kinase